MKKYRFFLGGHDAEMIRIKEVLYLESILSENSIDVVDANLGWGAHASAYVEEIADTVKDGFTPVLVELDNQPYKATDSWPAKVPVDLPAGTVIIDHHGDSSPEPASILQVLALLEVYPTRWDRIVAANDAGWFPGLMGLVELPGMGRLDPPATTAEMIIIRTADQFTQGLGKDIFIEVERALSAPVEMIGNIRIVRMTHSKTGPVGDRLAIAAIAAGAKSPADFPAFIVLSDDKEVNYSGDGATAAALHSAFPGGWAGGAGLGDPNGSAFWGGYPAHEDVLAFLKFLTELHIFSQ